MSLTEENPLLRKAIDAAPQQEIYRMLYDICATEPAIAKAFESRLVVTVGGSNHQDEDADKENASPGEKRKRSAQDTRETRASKRAKAKPLNEAKGNNGGLRTRWGKCRRCYEKYEVLANEEGDCIYHPGTSLYR